MKNFAIYAFVGLGLGLGACNDKKDKKVVAEQPRQTFTEPRALPPMVQTSPSPAPQTTSQTVTIQSKDLLLKASTTEPLTIQFDIAGVNPGEVNVLCRFARTEEFASAIAKACSGANSHKIDRVDAGVTYDFSVELVNIRTNVKVAEDRASIRAAKADITLTLEGADSLKSKTSGQVGLTVKLEGAANDVVLTCTLGAGKIDVPCKDGKINLDLDKADYKGAQELSIKAMGLDGSVLSEQSLAFCGGPACATDAPPADNVINHLGLGAGYAITLPKNMHLLFYSTNRSFDADQTTSLSVMNDALVVPERCGGITPGAPDAFNAGRIVPMLNGEGKIYQYCQKTFPLDEIYKEETGFRRAHNSIEFSSDAAALGQRQYERFVFNAFEDKPEAIFAKSRFWSLCSHAFAGGTANMQVINKWYGLPLEKVQVNFCSTQINGPYGQPIEVWVAGFFWVKPDAMYPSALEGTYIMEPGVNNFSMNPTQFHRVFAQRMWEMLEQTGLNEVFNGYLPY